MQENEVKSERLRHMHQAQEALNLQVFGLAKLLDNNKITREQFELWSEQSAHWARFYFSYGATAPDIRIH